MRENSKYDPAVAKILETMEKKNRVVKTKLVKRYQMSKEQYLKKIQENQNTHFKTYNKEISQQRKIKEQYEPSISEKSEKRESFLKSPSSMIISRNTQSKINTKKTALNLLMDKSKVSEYLRFSSIDDKLDIDRALQTMQDPSRMTFGDMSHLAPEGRDPILDNAASVNNPHDTIYNFMKTGSLMQDTMNSPDGSRTSRLPQINRSVFKAAPRIRSRPAFKPKTSVYLQKSYIESTLQP